MTIRRLLLANGALFILGASALAQTAAPPSTAPVPSASPLTVQATPSADIYFTGAYTATHWRTSEAIGEVVYNRANERIGKVEELVIDSSGQVLAVVIGVGGFLGMGERNVAVNLRAVQMSRDNDMKPRMVVDADKARLMVAPVFKPNTTATR
ncbi:MAG: PRC-barrel domain-containing protein [Alphaproteobacteria bacterium]